MADNKYDRTTQNVGNMLSMDHLNLTINDQSAATLFYIMGLGLTRDPYLTVGLDNMWVNAGRQQFHLPTRKESQVMRGHVGLVVPDLEALKERLKAVAPRLDGTAFSWSASNGYVEATCPWGNRFRCYAPGEFLNGAQLGLAYLLFAVPTGAAAGIARFYSSVVGAPASTRAAGGNVEAVVQAGRGQSLIFREHEDGDKPYDGHHIAVYLSDFSGPHSALDTRGLVSEESNDNQYRFYRIVDVESGDLLYELEHEVRSMLHPMYQRPLVNRNAAIDTRNYVRDADAQPVGG